MARHILGARVRDIEKRRMPSKHYVYVIHVNWTDGSVTIIYRRYSKFFDFHVKLLSSFPDEAGAKVPSHRTIPFLPGKKVFGRSQTREVALKRMNQLDDYCKYLVAMPAKISNSEDVITFFSPTPDDINPPRSPELKSSSSSSAIDEISDPIQAEQYKVIANYKKQQKNEVDLEAGDIVEVFEKNENGWWFISVQDSQGWAPGTFLAKADGSEDEEESISGNNEKFITNNKYVAQQDDELSFETGVVVKVIKKSLDGWWHVQYQDKLGWVPATYLQPYKGPDLVHTPAVEVIGNVMSISNLTVTSSPNLGHKSQFQSKPGSRGINRRFNTEAKPTPPRRSTVRKTVTNSIPKQRRRSQYRTTAAFTGHVDSNDCITFEAEQMLEVLHKNEEWWFVKVGDKEGWAPASFIEVINSSADQPPPPPPPSYPTASVQGAAIDTQRSGSTVSVDSETGAPRGPESHKFRINPAASALNPNSINGTGLPKKNPAPPNKKPNYVAVVSSNTGNVAKKPPAPPPAPTRPKSTPDNPPNKHTGEVKKRLRPVSTPKKSPTVSSEDDNRKSIAEIRAKLNRTIVNQNPAHSPPGDRLRKQLFRTVASFSDDEGLSFSEGVDVELIEKDPSGWWNVRIGSEEGWVPSNYLEPIN